MVANREEILSRLRESKQSLQEEFPLKRIALFGSYARATQIPGQSDIDILVEVDPSIGLGFVTLAERLEQLLGTRGGPCLPARDQTVALEIDRAGIDRCLSATRGRRVLGFMEAAFL